MTGAFEQDVAQRRGKSFHFGALQSTGHLFESYFVRAYSFDDSLLTELLDLGSGASSLK